MRRLITISIGILLFGATMDPTMFAQEVQGESARKIVTRATPAYPELARKMNLEGSVKVLVTVAPNGIVKSVHTIGGNPVLVKRLRIRSTSIGGFQPTKNPASS